MKEYMVLGQTPYDEDCVQVGTKDYVEKAHIEMQAYLNQLHRLFPDAEAKGIDFRSKRFDHDFGSYYEVCAYWNTNNEVADEYVYIIEASLPNVWDREALQELNLEPSKVESKDYGNWS
jgi:hypothetical protein